MKNLKKVLAFTLALAMVLSTMTMTFAASKEVEALANLKLLLNTTDAEVNQELTRAVGIAMVLKALGYDQAAANTKMAENKFVDMESASWAKGYATLGEELKITNGTSVEPKLFSPMQKLSEKSFVTFMLRALGYDSDKAWAEAGALSKEAGLTNGEVAEMGTFSKGQAAVIMYNALLAKVQNDEKNRTLAEKLVDENKLDKDLAVANGLMATEPEKLMVSEAKADNLKQVMVMFNGTADKDSAETIGNYKLQNQVVTDATLQEDGKTVVLTVEKHMVNKKETKLTVNNVKTVAGVAMDKQELMFTPVDNQYPEVKDVVFTGPRNLEIVFSEPINVDKINNTKVLLKLDRSTLNATVSKSEKMNVLNVKLNTKLKDGKEYTVVVGDAKDSSKYAYDYAGYPNIYFEGAYTYTEDRNAPEAKVVKANQKVVEIEFTKPVKGVHKENFYHSFSAYTAFEIYADAEMKTAVNANKPVSKVWVQFYNDGAKDSEHAIPGGTTEMVILNKAKGKTIKDNWGNEFATAAFKLEITADREAPEVVSVEVTGESEIKVTFNEEINSKDIEKNDKYVLLNEKGSEIERYSKRVHSENGGKVAKITLTKSYAGKTLTLNIKGLKDASLYQNMMSDYSTTLEFGDKTWKGVTSAEFKFDGSNANNYNYTLLVTFNENMDDSAIDVANYRFMKGKKIVGVKGTADFYEGKNNIVQFDLTYDKNKNDGSTDASFLAGNGATVTGSPKLILNDKIKDIAGNSMGTFQKDVDITNFSDNTGAPQFKSVEAVAANKVVVKFDKELVNLDTRNFVIKNNNNEEYTKDANYLVADDGKSIEIYLADNSSLGTALLKNLSEPVKLYYTANNDTYDIYGRSLEAMNVPQGSTSAAVKEIEIADKVAPVVATFVNNDKSANTTVDETFASSKDPVGIKNEELDGKPMVMVQKTSNSTIEVSIRFSEKLDPDSVSTTTFGISNDFVVTEVAKKGADGVIKLTAKKTNFDDVLEQLTITQKGTVKDEQGNESGKNLLSGDPMQVSTVTSLYPVEATIAQDTQKITVKFSRKLTSGEASKISATDYTLDGNPTGKTEATFSVGTVKVNNLAKEVTKEIKVKFDSNTYKTLSLTLPANTEAVEKRNDLQEKIKTVKLPTDSNNKVSTESNSDVVVSADDNVPSGLSTNDKWVAKTKFDTLKAAVETAKEEWNKLDKNGKDQYESAITALTSAISTFDTGVQTK